MAANPRSPAAKIVDRKRLAVEIERARRRGLRVVFTNGCFDLLHPGHVRYLRAARRLGDLLVVGVNSDRSVKRLKGANRPLLNTRDRCEMIAALEAVDFVTSFSEDTPHRLIERLRPDVLVKGGDWQPQSIVGADVVRAAGGSVRALKFAPGYSTSSLIARVVQRFGRSR